MLHDSYLIQRFEGPRPGAEKPGVKAHHIFSGGAGGPLLSAEGFRLLDPICTPEYMGAAEYEFGELSKAFNELSKLARTSSLRSFAFVLEPHERKLNFDRSWHGIRGPLLPAKAVCLFGFAPVSTFDEVQQRIRELALGSTEHYVKGGTRMDTALDPTEERHLKDPTCGWFDLRNTYMFFSSQKMWTSFCELFGIPLCEVPPLPEKTDFSKMKKAELVNAAVNLGVFRTKSQANAVPRPKLVDVLCRAQEYHP